MRKFTLLALAFLLGFTVSAQKHVEKSLFTTGPKVNKEINYNTKNSKAIERVLLYDNGIIGSGLGNADAHTIEAFHKFPAVDISDLVGKKITHFQVGLADAAVYTKAVVKILVDSINTTPVYSEDVTASGLVDGLNEFVLSASYAIPADKDLFIGMYFESTGGYGWATDTDGSTNAENSSLLIFNGEYVGSVAASYGDFILRCLLTDDGEATGLKDIAITNIEPKTDDCALTATEVLIVTLLNKGDSLLNEKFDLTVKVNDTPITMQVSPTGFVAGNEFEVEVSSFDMSAYETYMVEASHSYPDHILNNNSFKTSISTGDAYITVDLTTDAYPGETSWYILDENDEIVAQNGVLEVEKQTITNVCVNSAGCYTWVITDSYGDGIAGYNSPAGDFVVSYNGVEVLSCPAGGDFGTESYALAMGTGCPANEIVLTDFQMPYQMEPQELKLGGSLLNMGTDDLTSFDIAYVVNGDTSEVYHKTTFLPLGYELNFEHNVAYNFETPGFYSVEMIISNPNGEVDDESDNKITEKVIVSSTMVAKKQLFEHFTSSTCAPCAGYTPSVDALLATNPDEYSLIRYQVNWPGDGDPYYILQARDRVSYYGVTGVPSVFRNGEYNMDVTQEVFDTYAAEQTVIELGVTGAFNGDNVYVNANISTLANLPEGLTAHMVVVENVTEDNVGTNGETEFHNVMMQMLPSSAGTILGSVNVDGSVSLTQTFDMSETFVEEMDDLTAIVFIQDDETKEMLQSEMVPIEQGVAVTFNIDMTDAGITEGDVVYVTGSFVNWIEPGKAGSIMLTDEDGDMIYTGQVALPKNLGMIQYKYFLNAGWDGGEWGGDPNRELSVVEVDVVVDPADVWAIKPNVKENALSNISIYPNPFSNTLTLNNLGNATQVRVTNVIGQAVMTINVTNNAMDISTADLENGIYMITIVDANNNTKTERVVKN